MKNYSVQLTVGEVREKLKAAVNKAAEQANKKLECINDQLDARIGTRYGFLWLKRFKTREEVRTSISNTRFLWATYYWYEWYICTIKRYNQLVKELPDDAEMIVNLSDELWNEINA